MTWTEFLKTHWQVLVALDFFTVEPWTMRRLVRHHVFFVIKLAPREVKIAGLVPKPSKSWMLQVSRNLVDPWTGFLSSSRFLIHDRATLSSERFRQLLRSAQVEPPRLLARSPNLNAYAVRFLRTIQQECLARMVFFAEAALRRAAKEFALHYNRERNHQSLKDKIIKQETAELPYIGRTRTRKRLGGLLSYD